MKRTVHVTFTYEIDGPNDMACDALAEQERERWYYTSVILDADYLLTVTDYPGDGVWDVNG